MADLAAAYNSSGYAQSAQDCLPPEVKSVRMTAVKKAKGDCNPHFRMPTTSGTYQQIHYKTTNAHGIPVPEQVTYTLHVIEMLPSVCAGDLKHEWTNDHKMKISFKHSDLMSFPMMLLSMFRHNNTHVFGPDSALATSMEQGVVGNRGPDGHVWDGATITYSEPQDPDTVSPGDGLTGFDIIQVPHVRTDGIEVALNMLIVCTRTPKAVKQAVDVGFTKAQFKLQSNWGKNAANGGGGFQSPFNFGSPSFSPHQNHTSNGNKNAGGAFGNQFGMQPSSVPSNGNQHNAGTFGNQFGMQPCPVPSSGNQHNPGTFGNQFGMQPSPAPSNGSQHNPAAFGNQFGMQPSPAPSNGSQHNPAAFGMQPHRNPFAAQSNPSNGMQPSTPNQPAAVPSYGHPPSEIKVSTVGFSESAPSQMGAPGDAASVASALSYDNSGQMSLASLTSQVENLEQELRRQKAAAHAAEQEKQQLEAVTDYQQQQLQTAEAIVHRAEAEKHTAEELQRVALQEKTFAENAREQASVVLQRAEAQRKLGTNKRMRPELEHGASAENEEGGNTPMTDRKIPPTASLPQPLVSPQASIQGEAS
ncbi:unnamed protein product [Cylindrotheca closterium]|uniref:Uncharacterized protein n=1 Tax=Cylindrotheca closterium TaxID=2856 RepID=A0AAD2JP57_9STRA|nr:unnamed protein product [Cylindrotheca closterium]